MNVFMLVDFALAIVFAVLVFGDANTMGNGRYEPEKLHFTPISLFLNFSMFFLMNVWIASILITKGGF